MRRRAIAMLTILGSSGAFTLIQCVGDTPVNPTDGGGDVANTNDTGAPGDGGGGDADAAPLPSGILDPSFKNGAVTGVQMSAQNVAVDSQGRVYIAGSATCTSLPADAAYSNTDMAVARFLADGSVDTGYGTGGRACMAVGSGTADFAWGISIDPNGQAVVAGAQYGSANDYAGTAVVGRFTTAGVPDSTFGSGGHVLSNYGGFGHARILFDGGFIYVVGHGTLVPGAMVLELSTSGAPVTSFGTNGMRYPDGGFNGGVFSTPKVIGAGGTAGYGPSAIFVSALTANTGADAGTYYFALSDGGADFARDIEPSGTGFLVSATLGVEADSGQYAFPKPSGTLAAFKLTSGGTIDTSWAAPSGIYTTSSLMAFRNEAMTSLVQPGGQLVLAGLVDATVSGAGWAGDGALTRLKVDGTLDTTFGTNGIARLGTNKDTTVFDLALDPRDGSIVVLGLQGTNILLQRYTP